LRFIETFLLVHSVFFYLTICRVNSFDLFPAGVVRILHVARVICVHLCAFSFQVNPHLQVTI